MKIVYIHCEDNCVADVFSHIIKGAFPDEASNNLGPLTPHEAWKYPIGTVLSITTHHSVLESIKTGYNSDPFCLCLTQNDVPGAHIINGLWYTGDRPIIPRTGENLFHLTHDILGHFSTDK